MSEFNYFEAESHVLTYNKFRPSPPVEMIQEIVEFLQEKVSTPLGLAVDIGCGSGQSTHVLSSFFKEVIGVDPSVSIINEANKKNVHQNVSYRSGNAEVIDLPDESVDLITVAQAVHWFDLHKFYNEVGRVLKKNGVLAIYGYHLPYPRYKNRDDQLAALVKKYYTEVLGKYILTQSKKVYLDHYTGEEFNKIPFMNEPMLRKEMFTTETEATLADLTGYVCSWSGFQNYVRTEGDENGRKMLKQFENEFRSAMGVGGEEDCDNFKIQYNYFLLMGRKPSSI